jgi:mannose-6-phosphate isomerase
LPHPPSPRNPQPLAASLAAQYPGDLGLVVALLLNHVTLLPGEAIWMPAGNLHAYLHGTGVEIMAASDNVLRCGLTSKRVDVDELLRVLRFEVLAEPVVRPMAVVPGVVTWPTPAREFALYRALLDEATPRVEVELSGPREVLCLRGEVHVDDGVAAVTLGPGQAAFGPATSRPLACTGTGTGTGSGADSDYGEVYLAALPAPDRGGAQHSLGTA